MQEPPSLQQTKLPETKGTRKDGDVVLTKGGKNYRVSEITLATIGELTGQSGVRLGLPGMTSPQYFEGNRLRAICTLVQAQVARMSVVPRQIAVYAGQRRRD